MIQKPVSARCSVLATSLVWLLTAWSCRAFPLFLVHSGRGKCFTVIAPEGATLQVDYEAPDIVLEPGKENAGPAWITIHSRPTKPNPFDTSNLNQEWKFKRKPPPKLRPTSEELKAKKGSIYHDVQVSGEVDICVRASTARSNQPLRFGLKVGKKSNDGIKSGLEQDQHWTLMETEMRLLTSAMRDILSEADFSKDRESLFHQQTLSMHAASMWWPIVHLSVLLLTGFTQVSHIVRFFRSKRII